MLLVRMKIVTINLSYYNQESTLKEHILQWKSYSRELKELLNFCIVDDCSLRNAKDVLHDVDLSDIDIEIYRVKQDLVCNIAGVRNLAATVCKTEWMVILDMDTMIPEYLGREIINLAKLKEPFFKKILPDRKKRCYKFNRRVPDDPSHEKNDKVHPAVCLIRKDDYWNVGGCDEDLVGHYGQTDPIFWHRSKGKLEVFQMQNLYLDYVPAGEAQINRDNSHNEELFKQKIKTNKWSADFIRFEWLRLL